MATQEESKEKKLGTLALAAALLVVAGFVDATGFLTLGHLFVSFMSGNSTQAVIAAAQGAWREAAAPGGIIAAFLSGVVCGRLVAGDARNRRRPLILAAETVCLAAAALTPHLAAIAFMAFAMGAQNAVLHNVGAARTSLTYVTGTLVNLGETVAEALLGSGSALLPVAYLSQWVSLIAGGAVGAIAYRTFGLEALFAPAAALASLAILTSVVEPRVKR